MAKKHSSKSSWAKMTHFVKTEHKLHVLTLIVLGAIVVTAPFIYVQLLNTQPTQIKPAHATIGGGGGGLCGSKPYTWYATYALGGNAGVYSCSWGYSNGPVYCQVIGNNEIGNNPYCRYGSGPNHVIDPCQYVWQGNGGYCGDNYYQDGAGGAYDNVYYCYNHVAIGAAKCNTGCVHNPSGSDYCRSNYKTPVPGWGWNYNL